LTFRQLLFQFSSVFFFGDAVGSVGAKFVPNAAFSRS
jgi:hypothetical protein